MKQFTVDIELVKLFASIPLKVCITDMFNLVVELNDGENVGNTLGDLDGDLEGIFDGLSVSVGRMLGVKVGVVDGFKVGFPDGFKVG